MPALVHWNQPFVSTGTPISYGWSAFVKPDDTLAVNQTWELTVYALCVNVAP